MNWQEALGKERIIKQLEDLFKIKMPSISIRYSSEVTSPFCISPHDFGASYELEWVKREKEIEFRGRGLDGSALDSVDPSEFTIFLSTKHPEQHARNYGVEWHELAHVAAGTLGIRDEVLNETIAYACEFRGLLQAAKRGLFQRKEVADAISIDIQSAKSEPVDAFVFSRLEEMGLKGIPRRLKTIPHYSAFKTMKTYCAALASPDSDIDELITMLDKTIKYAVKSWRKRTRYPIIFGFAFAAALITLLLVMLHFLA